MTSTRRNVVALGGPLLSTGSFAIAAIWQPWGPVGTEEFFFFSVFSTWGILGALIVIRSNGHRIGWLFWATGVFTGLSFVADLFGTTATGAKGDPATIIAWISAWAADWVAPLLILWLLFSYPSGVLAGRLERVGAGLSSFICAAGMSSIAFTSGRLDRAPVENPFAVAWMEWLNGADMGWAGFTLGLLFVLSMVSLVRRLRTARGDEKQQLKWFVYSATYLAVILIVANIAEMVGDLGGDAIGGALFLVAMIGIPISTTMAILKYRLYDIDVLINRTLVYGGLTSVLAAVYLGLVFALQSVRPVGADSDVAVAASTLAVAALFRPVRSRVQGFIDRRFYRNRYDAKQTLVHLGQRLRDEVDLTSLERDILTVVQETVQPRHASLWVRT